MKLEKAGRLRVKKVLLYSKRNRSLKDFEEGSVVIRLTFRKITPTTID